MRDRAASPRCLSCIIFLPRSYDCCAASSTSRASANAVASRRSASRASSRHFCAQAMSGSMGASTSARAPICAAMRSIDAAFASSAAALSRARSRSHSSTSPNRSVSKSLSNNASRSSLGARKNREKSPCGRSTTWKNCSALMPRSSLTVSPISGNRVSATPDPSTHSSVAFAWTFVVPVPRFLGR